MDFIEEDKLPFYFGHGRKKFIVITVELKMRCVSSLQCFEQKLIALSNTKIID